MKKFIRKPIKEYNIIDMGILTIGALATIPVKLHSGVWIMSKD